MQKSVHATTENSVWFQWYKIYSLQMLVPTDWFDVLFIDHLYVAAPFLLETSGATFIC